MMRFFIVAVCWLGCTSLADARWVVTGCESGQCQRVWVDEPIVNRPILNRPIQQPTVTYETSPAYSETRTPRTGYTIASDGSVIAPDGGRLTADNGRIELVARSYAEAQRPNFATSTTGCQCDCKPRLEAIRKQLDRIEENQRNPYRKQSAAPQERWQELARLEYQRLAAKANASKVAVR